MAKYDSTSTEEPGQYPTTAWGRMGLPEQNFGSGAPGTNQPFDDIDEGGTNEPGQYPDRDPFTGVSYAGFQPDGSPGVGYGEAFAGGGDTVVWDEPTFYKDVAAADAGEKYDDDGAGEMKGYRQQSASFQTGGDGDWTQANAEGYNARASLQMPGVAGNTPTPGSGQHQTDGEDGSGHVMYGGFLRGRRPSTSRHPAGSGPGT